MTSILYAEINIICIITLLMLFFNSKSSKNGSIDQKLFGALIISTISVLVFDACGWIINGVPGDGAHIFNITANSLYFLLETVTGFIWLLYCDYKINQDEIGMLRRASLYAIPLFINVISVIINLFNNWIFSVSADNLYVRGPLIYLHIICTYFYLLVSFVITLKKARKIPNDNRNEFYYLAGFSAITVAASVVQMFFYGITLIWVAGTLSIIMIYINVQNKLISTDPLTGINNRRRLRYYLDERFKTIPNDSKLYAVMIDIDNFKDINDKYGSSVGDKALLSTSEILKKVNADNNNFLARTGADDFVIICLEKTPEDLTELINSIKKETAEFNRSKDKSSPFTLALSIGYSEYGIDGNLSSDAFLSDAVAAVEKEKEKYNLKIKQSEKE